VERALCLLKALANAQRLCVVDALSHGDRSVAELGRTLPGLSPSALSQHLGVLRAARVVRTRRGPHTVWYALVQHALDPLLRRLGHLYPPIPALARRATRWRPYAGNPPET